VPRESRHAVPVVLHAGSAVQCMGRVYGEPVEVQAREDGRPVTFAWRGRKHAVIAVQEHWVINRDWWREAVPVLGRPELRFWRVEAAGAGQSAGIYELREDIAAGTWTLRRIID
jgi:Domain of unknown function (DUF6504)